MMRNFQGQKVGNVFLAGLRLCKQMSGASFPCLYNMIISTYAILFQVPHPPHTNPLNPMGRCAPFPPFHPGLGVCGGRSVMTSLKGLNVGGVTIEQRERE